MRQKITRFWRIFLLEKNTDDQATNPNQSLVFNEFHDYKVISATFKKTEML